MPPKLQLLAMVAFVVAMLFLLNQVQKLEESLSKLGEEPSRCGLSGGDGAAPGRTAAGGRGRLSNLGCACGLRGFGESRAGGRGEHKLQERSE